MFNFLSLLIQQVKSSYQLPLLPLSSDELKARDDVSAGKFCTSSSHRNISLQFERYITEEDMKKQRERVATYDFCNSPNFLSLLIQQVKSSYQLPSLPPSSDELKARDDISAEKVCASLSRGSISLQFGRYITEEDMKKQRERVTTYDFCE